MNHIALVMIARNEARCIERGLNSARPWVDEMVVLDTGSTDGTPGLAQGCGAKVAHFDWVNDFSAARNAALGLTKAPWRLVIDADEWLAGGMQALAQLRERPADFIGQIVVNSTFEQTSSLVEEAPSWLSRVLPAGVHYCGRVHEQPQSALPRVRLPLVLAHDGYLPANMQSKRGRNAHLLRLALAQSPNDAYLQYQQGKDFEVQGAFQDAAPWYEKAIAGVPFDAPWRHDLVLRRLFVLKKLGAFEAALAMAQQELAVWEHSPDFYFTLGDLFLDWARHDGQRAAELLPMIESSWLQAIQIGERPELPDTVRGRGSFLAAHNLAVFHDSLGDAVKASEWKAREQAMRDGAL